jgi:hypothetical protein
VGTKLSKVFFQNLLSEQPLIPALLILHLFLVNFRVSKFMAVSENLKLGLKPLFGIS